MKKGCKMSWLVRSVASLWLSSLLMGCARGSRLFPFTTSLEMSVAPPGGSVVGGVGGGGSGGSSGSGGGNSSASVGPGESTDLEEERENATIRCDDARLRCAYRTGCGSALQHYLTRCASVLHGDAHDCPENCQYALIGLMSSDEGKELMTCDCAKEDSMCWLSKQRAEICRASVTTMLNRTRVSCRIATWICNGDVLCATALQYYNENCKRMFHGKKCTKRCRNSLNILRRQEKAAQLNTCFCDGAEEFDCLAIHRNMDELCYNRPAQQHNYQEQHRDAAADAAPGRRGSASPGSPRSNKPANRATISSTSASWTILLLSLVLLLHSLLTKE